MVGPSLGIGLGLEIRLESGEQPSYSWHKRKNEPKNIQKQKD